MKYILTFLCLLGSLSAQDLSSFGYYKVVAVSPPLALADPIENAAIACQEALEAHNKEACLLLFPELSLTGYTAEDLFLTEDLLQRTKKGLAEILRQSVHLDTTLVVGAPYRAVDGRLYNTAFVIYQGKIIGAVPKTHLPNYSEFYEKRWFVSGQEVEMDVYDPVLGSFHLGTRQLFQIKEMIFGIEICEDLWAVQPPSNDLCLAGANVILNLSASNELVGKSDYRKALIDQQSSRLLAAYIYASAGPLESTKDLVFGGHLLAFENGSKLAESNRFQLEGERISVDVDIHKLLHERQKNGTFGQQQIKTPFLLHFIPSNVSVSTLQRSYTKTPFIPSDPHTLEARLQEIVSIQATGLARRLIACRAQTMVIGISGGLDSTLALLVAKEAVDILHWDSSQIIAVTMPGFGTTTTTKSAAYSLMQTLGVTIKEISIIDAVNQHFKDIGQDPKVTDITYENSQARERTQILFDLANKLNGLVVGTGDLSELCLGWCTYNGDHMASYGVNSSVPKTLVKHLVGYFVNKTENPTLRSTLETILSIEISPELLPIGEDDRIVQPTEEIVGPYKLHDFFIYHYLRNGSSVEKVFFLANETFKDEFNAKTIQKWLRVFIQRYYQQQFKRTTLPSGPKVGSVSVSPRGDLRMPDEASCVALLKTIDQFQVEQ